MLYFRVWYIYIAYIYHKNQPNVGKYTIPIDPVGYNGTKRGQQRPHISPQHLNLFKRESSRSLVRVCPGVMALEPWQSTFVVFFLWGWMTESKNQTAWKVSDI